MAALAHNAFYKVTNMRGKMLKKLLYSNSIFNI